MTALPVTFRLPFADVEQYLAASITAHADTWQETGPTGYLAARLGTTRRTVHRWRVTGLSERQADWVATRLGQHPAAVFTDWETAEQARIAVIGDACHARGAIWRRRKEMTA